MTFKDIFKRSFLDGYASMELSGKEIVMALLLTFVLALYIFFCYRIFTRRTFYSKSFNLSLVGMSLITAGIILTIQSSVVVSLGMVGALSIVRFRTAIKDPMDLVFLYWSISVGIICGAGLAEIAILFSIAVTVAIIILDHVPGVRAPMILTINAKNTKEVNDLIDQTIPQFTKYYKEKTRTITNGRVALIYELRIKDGSELVRKLGECEDIQSVSILSHDGETAY